MRKRKIHTIPIISDADTNNLFEGGIQKTPNLMKMYRREKLMKRDAMPKKTWPEGIVPYRFDDNFNNGNNITPSNDGAFFWLSLSVSLFSFLFFLRFFLHIATYIYLIVTLSLYSFVYAKKIQIPRQITFLYIVIC